MPGWFERLTGKKRTLHALDMLNGRSWACTSCGEQHQGMFAIGACAPDYWPNAGDFENNDALSMDGDFLSEDFCVLGGEDFFVRCVFEIPVLGMDEKFGFGVWSTLSRDNFQLYVDQFNETSPHDQSPWFGYFSNSLRGFEETVPEPCEVHPQPNRQRPVLILLNEDHQLARAQREGISPERVLEIYGAYGHLVG